MGLVFSGSKGSSQKKALRVFAGCSGSYRRMTGPAICPWCLGFSSLSRAEANSRAELVAGSLDATKKLEAKGRPVDFQQLAEGELDGGTTNVR